jgi:hypothetical protein
LEKHDRWAMPRARGPVGWNAPALSRAQRAEICRKYEEALEGEPGLSKVEFARRTAPSYGVSAATIRRVLYM